MGSFLARKFKWFSVPKNHPSCVCSSRFVYFPRQFYVQLSKCHHRKLKQGDIFDKNGLEFQVYIDRVMIGSAITMKLIQKDGYDEWGGNKNHNFMPGFLNEKLNVAKRIKIEDWDYLCDFQTLCQIDEPWIITRPKHVPKKVHLKWTIFCNFIFHALLEKAKKNCSSTSFLWPDLGRLDS